MSLGTFRPQPNPGSSGGFSIDDIIRQFQTEQANAQAAKAAQFQQLMATIQNTGAQAGGTFNEALDRVRNLGNTARERVDRQGQRTLASGQQDLISSGFSASTLAPNLRRAVEEDVQFQQGAIDESVGAQQSGLLAQRAGNETQIGGMLANAIGGQQINGPDLGLFASLLQQLGAAGNGQPVSAFIPPTSANVNAPNSVFQRPTTGGSGGGSVGGPAGTTGGTGGPNGNARVVRNTGTPNDARKSSVSVMTNGQNRAIATPRSFFPGARIGTSKQG